jgi:hypothetical protein
MARVASSGSGGASGSGNIDGGHAASVYLVSQVINGGGA